MRNRHQVHVRRIELRGGNVPAPGDVARAGGQQDKRKHRQRKRRGVEDVHAPAVLVPADQLLRGQPKRHHRELQIEPVRLEPEEQIDAEDDGKRSEAERVGVAPRPAEQHVERVREEQLGEDEGAERVNRRPIPAPIQQHRALRAGLQIVLLPQDHIQVSVRPLRRAQKSSIAFHAHSTAATPRNAMSTSGFGEPRQQCKAGETEGKCKRQKPRSRIKQIRPACFGRMLYFHFTHCVLVRPRSAGQASPIRG